MGKRVAILQSNYIPWRGYFDIIGSVDEFVLYDSVQFTKNDWRNRNRIKTANGTRWLTIPVITSGRFGQTIKETRIASSGWASKHWRTLSLSYAKAPYFERYRERFAEIYRECGETEYLWVVNRMLIEAVVAELRLPTRISESADYLLTGNRTERLVSLCRTLGADVYISGPSASSYLDLRLFHDASMSVEFFDYSGYGPYPQLHGAFEPAVSILDLLFNVGPEASSYMSFLRAR